MSDEDKAPFNERAAEGKVAYATAMEEYKRKLDDGALEHPAAGKKTKKAAARSKSKAKSKPSSAGQTKLTFKSAETIDSEDDL